MFGAMTDTTETWRERLAAAIEKAGKTERSVSLEIGRAPGYLHGILKEGKEPGIDSFAAIANAVNVSLAWLLYGAEFTGNSEKLLRLFSQLNDDQQADFLRMAESVAAVAKPRT